MPGKSPLHVFPNERRAVIEPGAQGGEDFGRARSVAQAHGQIAQPSLVADAANRRAAHALVEFGFAPGEQLGQGGPVEPVPYRKVIFPGNPREPVPWADRLAIVAAVDPVADQRAQLFGNRALVLDGQVRDAAPRVELVRSADRLGGAYVDAFLTGSAVFLCRGIER